MYKYLDEDVNVPLTRLQEIGFSERDIEIHQDLFSYDVYRKAFGDDNGNLSEYNLRFVGPRILDIARIENDSTYDRSQPYRAAANPEGPVINRSFEEDGYTLSQMLPAVIYERKAETYKFLDGRSRCGILEVKGVSNALVNRYEPLKTDEVSMAKTRRFPMFLNTLGFSKGKATKEDVETFLIQQARKSKKGKSQLELLYGSIDSLYTLTKALKSELKAVNMKLSSAKIVRLASDLYEKIYGKSELVTFNDGNDARRYVEKNWGWKEDHPIPGLPISGWDDNEKVALTFIPTDAKHGDNAYKDKLLRMRLSGDNRKLIGILYESDPKTRNSEEQFRENMLTAKDRAVERWERIGEEFFGGAKFNKDNYNIVACIPYVVSLSEEYPLEKPYYL